MTLSAKRNGRVTGSQAGAILGLCPWRSSQKVRDDWLYGSTFEGNVATEHGNFYEEYALADLGATPQDDFFIHPYLNWLGATPDAIVNSDCIAEVKCPYSKRRSAEFKPLAEQPHYYAQVQIEMACTQTSYAKFFQWSPEGSKLEIVRIDHAWLDRNIPELWRWYRRTMIMKRKPHPDTLGLDYLAAQAEFDAAKEKLDAIKRMMIDAAKGEKARFGTVTCTPSKRAGSVSYAKVVKDCLPDIDLEPYRGKPTTVWSFKDATA